jgi:hypothetical protein
MKRLTQPSTWAGFAAILGVVAGFLPPQYQVLAQAITAGLGSMAVALNEKAGG